MSETVLSVEDAAARLSELVERVHTRRESTVITVSGRPVARIVPLSVAMESVKDMIAFLHRWRSLYPGPDEQFERD